MKRIIALLFVITVMLCSQQATAEEGLRLFAINVRKADCILLFCGDDIYMIDTGSSESWGQVSAALHSMGINHLSGVIITHTDKDHVGGLQALASSSIEVDRWYAPAYFSGVKAKNHPLVLAAEVRNTDITWLKSGDTLPLDGGELLVLGPRIASETENCNSLVLLARSGEDTILLTGDMEFDEEDDLLAAGLIPQCKILKVGNHGESDATGIQLIQTVQPKAAIISTNTDDERDTPAPRVLNLLNKYQVEIYVTQTATAGIWASFEQGEPLVYAMDWEVFPEMQQGMKIAAKKPDVQTVTVTNEGDTQIELSGWYIYSERGGEIFVFPDGIVLMPGDSLVIACEGSTTTGDLVWHEEKVWARKKADAAILYDPWGRQADRFE